MTTLDQPFYVERDGLRGVIMPMPDGRFNWMLRATITKTNTCDYFESARNELQAELAFLAMMGDVVSVEDSAPATTAAVVPLHPYGAHDDY